MVACAQHAGYTSVARVPEARAWDGRRWDSVRLGLLRAEWQAARTPAADDAAPLTPPDIAFREGEVPAAEDLRRLYDAVGWSAYTQDMETLAAGVAGSSRVVTGWAGDVLVGLARVVSDGHTIAYLQDLLVDPAHQRRGIASELLRRVFAPYVHVRQHVLITDAEPGQRAFYEAAGFCEIRDGRSPGRAFVRFAA
ncbi:N-acetyltransferase [Micrococcus flavus]|nr:N-acetyltransferase [Micrococcus flavus]